MSRKIAIITGSRGEYGYIRPIIRRIEKDPDLEYEIIITNLHLLHEFGYSAQEIKKDGFKISESIHNTFDGYNHQTMVKSLGVFLMQAPEAIDRLKPDIILLAGDRGEQLMAAITGSHLYIPVAHIQAGEVSGNIDDATRHAIARYAHVHFAASQQAADRLIKSGEQDFRVYNTGAPMLDELVDGSEIAPKEEIFNKFGFDSSKPIFLLVMHPVTEEYASAAENTVKVLQAVNSFGAQVVIIFPNSDAGSKEVRNVINKNRSPLTKIFRNLPRREYAGIMNVASVMIGNSSSGLIESPVFKLPTVNVGRRQLGREYATNIIHSSYDTNEVVSAIKRALSAEFKTIVSQAVNPYGDGASSERIVNILKNLKIDDKLLIKRITF